MLHGHEIQPTNQPNNQQHVAPQNLPNLCLKYSHTHPCTRILSKISRGTQMLAVFAEVRSSVLPKYVAYYAANVTSGI